MHKERDVDRPSFDQYPDWLEMAWKGDNRDLRPGRFLHQQADLYRTFIESTFWEAVTRSMLLWADEYKSQTGHSLFSGGTPDALQVHMKPWESFLNKTWRTNVKENRDWPRAPAGGWLFPDSWFEGFWDVIRSRLSARYLDGVAFVADKLRQTAIEHEVEFQSETKAKDTGYYAVHFVVVQPFETSSLDYGETEYRRSQVEIQVTTGLQEIVGELTHPHFARDRDLLVADDDHPWQWQYTNPEFSPYYLGHVLHWVEGVIMTLRDDDGGEA